MSNYQNFSSLHDYLEKAYQLGNSDRYAEAYELLDEAENLPPDMLGADGLAQIERVRDELTQDRDKRIYELTQQIKAAMQKSPEELTEDDLEAGEHSLALLSRVLPNPVEWERINENWRAFRQNITMEQEIETAERELKQIWLNESKLNTVAFDRALVRARQLADAYPESEEAKRLFERAVQERKGAYEYIDERVTQQGMNAFDALIEIMQADYDRGIKTLPFYDIIEGELTPVAGEEVTAEQALGQVMALRTRYQNTKIQEYIDRAQAEMKAHPQSALKIIEDAKKTFVYADQGEKQRLDQFIENEIKPRIRNRELAEELATEARKDARNNPERAWDQLNEAKSIDELTPVIKHVEEAIKPHLKLRLEDLLKDAEEMRQAGKIQVARNTAGSVEKYAKSAGLIDIEARAANLKKACNDDETLLKQLQEIAEKIEALVDTDLKTARELLQQAQKKILGRPEHFRQPLLTAQAKVEERASVRELFEELQIAFESLNPDTVSGFRDLSQERLKDEALREVKNIQSALKDLEQKTLKLRSRSPQFNTLLAYIRGRLDLISGRLSWKVGSYQDALEDWRRCSEKGVDDDKSLAQKWIAHATDATAVTGALKKARQQRQAKEYKSALETLEPWRSKASPKLQEVQSLYRSIKSAWIKQLKKEIDTGKRDDGGKLNAQDIINRLDQLQALDREEARKYADKQVKIYRSWAESSPTIEKKIEYYKNALEVAGKPSPAEIVKGLFWAERKQFWDSLENEKTAQVLAKLRDWITKHPYDVETRIKLIRRLLNNGDDARIDIEMAEGRIERAHKEREPFEAGFANKVELQEAELILKALKHHSQGIITIAEAKNAIRDWMQPDKGISEYCFGETELGKKKDALYTRQEEMKSELAQNKTYRSLPPEAQERVKKEWDRVRTWMSGEAQMDGEFHDWYKEQKKALTQTLRERWRDTTPIPVESLKLMGAQPTPAQMDRLRIGLKILFLSKGDPAGRMALNEHGALSDELKQETDALTTDVIGPAFDLENTPLTPPRALEKQQEWTRNLRKWARELDAINKSYSASMDACENRSSGQDGGQTKEEMEDILKSLEDFWDNLKTLNGQMSQVRANLERAIGAGDISFDGHVWQDVPWRKVARELIEASAKKADKSDLSQLDAVNIDARDKAWNKAADVLMDAHLDAHVEKAPWQKIDPIIRDAKIDERWEAVLDPIAEVSVMSGHRVLKWLKEETHKAKRTRDRLVLAAAYLYTLVQAERFGLALEQMDHMEQLDAENKFGFRTGKLIKDPIPYSWDALKEHLSTQKAQWEAFQAWWQPVESSALPVWRQVTSDDPKTGVGRERFVQYVRKAEYEDAYRLAIDALYGVDAISHFTDIYKKSKIQQWNGSKIKGEFANKLQELESELGGSPPYEWNTNALGGGLALAPLLKYLQQLPDALSAPSSRRMERALQQVEKWLHDVKESIAEVRFWLDGVSRPGRIHPDMTDPVPELQQRFDELEEELNGVIAALSSPWPFGKKGQREYGRDVLNELKDIAPDRSYDEFESLL